MRSKKIISKDLINLLFHSKNYLSANLLVAILSFLTLPIITRFLNTEEYGLVSIFISITAILNIIFILSINNAIKINYIKKEFNHKEYLFSNLIFILILNIFFILILFLISNYVNLIFNIPIIIIIFAGLTSIGHSFLSCKLKLLQAKQESKKYSMLSASKEGSIILISLFFIYFLSNNKELGYVYTALIITLIFSIYSFISLLRESKFKFKLIYVKDALYFGIPLLPHLLAGFLLRFFDQLIINQLVGTSETGIYSLGYKVGSLMFIIALSSVNAWQPIYWNLIKEKKWKQINKLAEKLSLLIFWMSICLILFSKEIIILLSEKSFHEATLIVPFVVLSYIFFFLYTLYSGISFYYKKTWIISLTTILVAIVNIVLNYKLIPLYGFYIAAITTLISYILLFILHLAVSRYVIKYNKLRVKNIILKLSYVISGFLIYLLINNIKLNFILEITVKIIILGIISFFMFKKEISSIVVSLFH